MEEDITIWYKADGRLVGSRAPKRDTAKLSELQFADDYAILAQTKEKVVHAMSKLFEITSQWGLTISVPKTKVLVVGGRDEEEHFLSVGDRQLEIVEEFKHLVSVIHHSGSAQSDIRRRTHCNCFPCIWEAKEINVSEQVTDNPDQTYSVQGCSTWNPAIWLRDMDNQKHINPEVGDFPQSLSQRYLCHHTLSAAYRENLLISS